MVRVGIEALFGSQSISATAAGCVILLESQHGGLLTIRDWVITVPDMGFVHAPRARGVYIGMLM
jgi:hypothetical protein